MAASVESKLERFCEWLQVNGAQLRGCRIEYCGPSKGFGIFSTSAEPPTDGVFMVVPLDLAITPMRVLQDPLLGPVCGEIYEEGGDVVDDRFLVILFLTVERLRPNSPWKPYIDMLPSSFDSPLWFTEEELSELKGTSLYRATMLQKQSLKDVFDKKAKGLVLDILHSDGSLQGSGEVNFEDFLWANSIFWSRALNIPFPHSYVFPSLPVAPSKFQNVDHKPQALDEAFCHGNNEKNEDTFLKFEEKTAVPSEAVWAEGLVPGIDFCNYNLAAVATWEVDDTGSKAGLPSSMYLLSVAENNRQAAREIFINYGDKGNEELLYLYGFVMEDNQHDYLMIHYPVDAFRTLPSADSKGKLLKAQNAEMRCLLPRNLLDQGFFCEDHINNAKRNKSPCDTIRSYSWSGQRNVPSYLHKLVFPGEFLTSLRTIAMNEQELDQVSSLLEELIGSDEKRQPSDVEVQSAIWEVCGDSAALQLLVDLLQARIMELEEGSGTEENDVELLQNFHTEFSANHTSTQKDRRVEERKRWSSIVYRRGQKQLARLFLKEAEHALDLCLKEQT